VNFTLLDLIGRWMALDSHLVIKLIPG